MDHVRDRRLPQGDPSTEPGEQRALLALREPVAARRGLRGGFRSRPHPGLSDVTGHPAWMRWLRSWRDPRGRLRSEEHTSELQSRRDLVCRLLLEKKKKK